jgi:hypothetical protein
VACREEECLYGFDGKARRKEIARKILYRWENNTKTDLIETEWDGMDWDHLA